MKGLFVALGLWSMGTPALAIGDLERVAGFYFNALSGGTYLADLEGQKATIHLEMEKQKAQMMLDVDKQTQQLEVRYYVNEVSDYTQILATENAAAVELQKIIDSTNQVQSSLQDLVLLAKKEDLSLKLILSTTRDLSDQMKSAADMILSSTTPDQLKAQCDKDHDYTLCVWANVKQSALSIQGSGDALKDLNPSQLLDVVKSILYSKVPLDTEFSKLQMEIQQTSQTIDEANKLIVQLGGQK